MARNVFNGMENTFKLRAISICMSVAAFPVVAEPPSAGVYKGQLFSNTDQLLIGQGFTTESRCAAGVEMKIDGSGNLLGSIISHDHAVYDLDGDGVIDSVNYGNAINCVNRGASPTGFTRSHFAIDLDGNPGVDVESSLGPLFEVGDGIFEFARPADPLLDVEGTSKRNFVAITPDEGLMLRSEVSVYENILQSRLWVMAKADEGLVAADLEGQSFSGVSSDSDLMNFLGNGPEFTEFHSTGVFKLSFQSAGSCMIVREYADLVVHRVNSDGDNDLSNGDDGFRDYLDGSNPQTWHAEKDFFGQPQNCSYSVDGAGRIEVRAESDPINNTGIEVRIGDFYLDTSGQYLVSSHRGDSLNSALQPVDSSGGSAPLGTEDPNRGFLIAFKEHVRSGSQQQINDAVVGTYLIQGLFSEFSTGAADKNGITYGSLILLQNDDANPDWNSCLYEDRGIESSREAYGVASNSSVWGSLWVDDWIESAVSCRYQIDSNSRINLELGWDDNGDGAVDFLDQLQGVVSENNQSLSLRASHSANAFPVVPNLNVTTESSVSAMIGIKFTGDLLSDVDGDGINALDEFWTINDFRLSSPSPNSLIEWLNQSLPVNSSNDFLIAPFWDDLAPSDSGRVVYKVSGVAPNREFVIEWQDILHFSSCNGDCVGNNADPTVYEPQRLTFQVEFNEGDNNIYFHYLDVDAPNLIDDVSNHGVANAGAATIGVQFGDGSSHEFSFNSPSVNTGETLVWSEATSEFTVMPTWADDMSGATDLELCDDCYAVIDLPFSINLNGEMVDVIAVSDNGLIGSVLGATLGDLDGDGIPDGFDVDSDNDGMPDALEVAHGFDPFDPSDVGIDTDNDGWTLGEEITLGTDDSDSGSNPGKRFTAHILGQEKWQSPPLVAEVVSAERENFAVDSGVVRTTSDTISTYIERSYDLSASNISFGNYVDVSDDCVLSSEVCESSVSELPSRMVRVSEGVDQESSTLLIMNRDSLMQSTVLVSNYADEGDGEFDIELSVAVHTAAGLTESAIDGTSWELVDNFKLYPVGQEDNDFPNVAGTLNMHLNYMASGQCDVVVENVHQGILGSHPTNDWRLFTNNLHVAFNPQAIQAQLDLWLVDTCAYRIDEPKGEIVTDITFANGRSRTYHFAFEAENGDLIAAAYTQGSLDSIGIEDLESGMAVAVRQATNIFDNSSIAGDYWVMDKTSTFNVDPGSNLAIEFDSVGRTLWSLYGDTPDEDGYSSCTSERSYRAHGQVRYGSAGVDAVVIDVVDAQRLPRNDGQNGKLCRYKVFPSGALEIEFINAVGNHGVIHGFINDSRMMVLNLVTPKVADMPSGTPINVSRIDQTLAIGMFNGHAAGATGGLDIRNFLSLPGVNFTPLKNDFDGDGLSDVLWRNTTSGQTQVSISDAQGNIDRIEYQWKLRDSDWIAEGNADFNGDGFADTLWRNAVSGQTQVSISNAQGNIDRIEYQWKLRDSDWAAEGIADFNGDGFSDVLWRNTLSGQTQVSISNAQGNIGRIEYQWKLRDSTWSAEGASDFNGDGFADALWRNTVSGQTQVSISNAQGNIDHIEYQWKLRDTDWAAEGIADFNGDGFVDVLWRNTLSGQTQVSISNAQGNIDRIEYQWKLRDTTWVAEGIGDFNGDGFTDALWRNTVSGQTQVSVSNALGNIDRIEYQWKLRNTDWKAEGVADFDGDGFADVLWRNIVNGQTQISISNPQGNIDHLEYQWKLRGSDWQAVTYPN